MKRFNFPLERVRRWRQDRADTEQMRLAQLYRETKGVEGDRKTLVDAAVRSGRDVLAQHYVTAQDLYSLAAFKEYTAQQIRRLDQKLRTLAESIRKQQALVFETHRDFQLLEGLRDGALLSWTAARDKEHEEIASELFLARRTLGVGKKRGQIKRNGLNSRRPVAVTAPISTSIN